MSAHREHKIVDIKVDGQHLDGTLLTPAAPVAKAPGILFVHGWGGNQEQYLTRAREAAAVGCICLAFDLRGHARSEGHREEVSREDNLHDVLAAYDVLARQAGVERSAMAVVGSSYGGYLGAILTSLRPVRWLGMRAPALYEDNHWELPKQQLREVQDLAAYRRRVLPPDDNRALQACTVFQGDVLIVESEHDDIVPHPAIASYRRACLKAATFNHRIIDDADHSLSDERWQRAYTEILVGWLYQVTEGVRERLTPACQA